MGPTWGPSGSCRPQMVPMLAPWTLLSGSYCNQARGCSSLGERWFDAHSGINAERLTFHQAVTGYQDSFVESWPFTLGVNTNIWLNVIFGRNETLSCHDDAVRQYVMAIRVIDSTCSLESPEISGRWDKEKQSMKWVIQVVRNNLPWRSIRRKRTW